MAIEFNDAVVKFEGHCRLEEASALFEWLEQTPAAKIDLTDCERIHTAILQILMVAKPELLASPANPFLKQWLLAYTR